ncbi:MULTISPECIES: sensor domain-containing diguanylate cyclase [Nocardia]|uniref:sensor domain-containing diguanylate cyclase n=1 Tax=Nocardia TaxID=1817 RepID=UPI000D688AD4|nr:MULTISPECIES: sensor domain-containing diguanylate cyclase [Nocardia]
MDEAARSRLLSRWSGELAALSAAPVPPASVGAILTGLVESVEAGMNGELFDAGVGLRVGSALASLGFVDAAVPGVSTRALYELVEQSVHPDAGVRFSLLATAIGQGHHTAQVTEPSMTPVGNRSLVGRADAVAVDELFRMAFDNVAVAIGIADIEGTFAEVNRCLADSVGLPLASVRGMSMFEFAHPEEVAEIRRLVSERLVPVRRGTIRTESRVVAADGRVRWLACSITYVPGVSADDFLLAVGQDITERHRLQEELRWQSRHDSLTGLPNRRYLLEQIEQMCRHAGAGDRLGLCFVDIDEFKRINDRYGHVVGDRVLSGVATRLRECCAIGDVVARIGGDEFVILIPPPVDDRRIVAVVDSVLAGLGSPVVIDHREIPVSASMGTVVADIWGARSEVLLDAADRELYRAKKDGKDRWKLCVLEGTRISGE